MFGQEGISWLAKCSTRISAAAAPATSSSADGSRTGRSLVAGKVHLGYQRWKGEKEGRWVLRRYIGSHTSASGRADRQVQHDDARPGRRCGAKRTATNGPVARAGQGQRRNDKIAVPGSGKVERADGAGTAMRRYADSQARRRVDDRLTASRSAAPCISCPRWAIWWWPS